MKILTLQDGAGTILRTSIDRDSDLVCIKLIEGFNGQVISLEFHFDSMRDIQSLIDDLNDLKLYYLNNEN